MKDLVCLDCEYALLCVSAGPDAFFRSMQRCDLCGGLFIVTGYEREFAPGRPRQRSRQIILGGLSSNCPLDLLRVTQKLASGRVAWCSQCEAKKGFR